MHPCGISHTNMPDKFCLLSQVNLVFPASATEFSHSEVSYQELISPETLSIDSSN